MGITPVCQSGVWKTADTAINFDAAFHVYVGDGERCPDQSVE